MSCCHSLLHPILPHHHQKDCPPSPLAPGLHAVRPAFDVPRDWATEDPLARILSALGRYTSAVAMTVVGILSRFVIYIHDTLDQATVFPSLEYSFDWSIC